MCTKKVAFIILCCFLGVHIGVVNGRYLLNVTLVGYTNPNQRCADCAPLRCCDTDFDTNNCFGGRRCDTFFFFCLRPFGSTGRGCSYSGDLTSEVNVNDAAINFNQMRFLGLDNPLSLEGLTDAWNSVQIYIEARDQDGNDQYQLIDNWRINNELPVGVQSGTQEFDGDFGIMTLTVTSRVLCAQNFTGSDCTQCIRGLTGSMCNETNDCVNVTCSGRGRCLDGVDSFTCNCDPGFTGAECEENTNECIDPGMNCSGNGQCVDEFGSYSCNCNAGYNGTDCEINIDDCSPNPCGASGQCIDGVDSFACNCVPGYTGTLCDTDVDECLSNPCGTNGQCESGEGSFNCSCNPGFTGEFCQTDIDECVGVNCSGNGVCLDGVNSFACQCSSGFSGILCSEAMKLRDSKLLVPIVGGTIGGVLVIIIFLIPVMVFITVKCRIRQLQKLKLTIVTTPSIEMKENEGYGVAMAIQALQAGQPQMSMPDDTFMSRNVCYATAQHMEIVDNECYGCVSTKQQTVHVHT